MLNNNIYVTGTFIHFFKLHFLWIVKALCFILAIRLEGRSLIMFLNFWGSLAPCDYSIHPKILREEGLKINFLIDVIYEQPLMNIWIFMALREGIYPQFCGKDDKNLHFFIRKVYIYINFFIDCPIKFKLRDLWTKKCA